MTILQSAYDTFLGRVSREAIKRVVIACQDAQHNTGLLTANYYDYLSLPQEVGHNTNGVYRGALVTHGSPAEALIPAFIYPVIVEDPTASAKGDTPLHFLVGDARYFMAANRNSAERCRIVNQMEFELLRVQLATGMSWLADGPQKLLNMGPVMGQVYCRWLAGTIGKRFELDGTERLKARVVAAYFFQCNFIHNVAINGQQKAAMVALACRSAGVPQVEYENLLKDVTVIESAEDFVTVLRQVLDTPRLDNFNIGLLSSVMQGTWFGFNGRELACAAIEHPPTFAALLYMSFYQNSYRNAALAQVSADFKGSKGGADFVRNMNLQLKLR